MFRVIVFIIAASLSTLVYASSNGAHDYLMSISPKERAATLAGVVGEGCKGKRSFYQGSGTSPITKKNIAIWNVECTNGKSYVIEVRPDGSGGVLECSVLAAVNGGKCFKKF